MDHGQAKPIRRLALQIRPRTCGACKMEVAWMATHEEATSHKEQVASMAVAALPAKVWNHLVEPNPQAAANFLNLPPAQVAGEGMVSNRADGNVDVYYFL
jgi:hypothetical protein